jgi:hypothetical protein
VNLEINAQYVRMAAMSTPAVAMGSQAEDFLHMVDKSTLFRLGRSESWQVRQLETLPVHSSIFWPAVLQDNCRFAVALAVRIQAAE